MWHTRPTWWGLSPGYFPQGTGPGHPYKWVTLALQVPRRPHPALVLFCFITNMQNLSKTLLVYHSYVFFHLHYSLAGGGIRA